MSGVFVEPAIASDASRKVRPVERPSTFLETTGAAFGLAADDSGFNSDRAKLERSRSVLDAIPRDVPRKFRFDFNPFTSGIDTQNDIAWDTLVEARRRTPSLLPEVPKTRAEYDAWILAPQIERRRQNQDTVRRAKGASGVAASLIGGIGGSFTDPLNIATLPLGGGAAKSIGGVMAREALINGAVEAVEQPFVAMRRNELGETLTLRDAVENVGLAAIGSAVLGGAIDGTSKAIDALLPRDVKIARAMNKADIADATDADVAAHFRKTVPQEYHTPEQTAALHVLDREIDVRASNPYTSTPEGMNAHNDRLQAAMDVMLSAPVLRTARPLDSVLTDNLDRGTPSMRVPRGKASIDSGIVQFFTAKGYSPAQARGIAAGIEAESRSDHNIRGGYKGRALGLGQWLGPRREAIIREFGPNPTREQQLEFLHRELQGGDAGGAAVRGAKTEAEALGAYIRDFMRPAKGAQTDGDLSRGMAALGREREALPGGRDGIAVDGEFVARNPDLNAARPDYVARGTDDLRGIDLPEPPQLRRELFADDASHAAAQAAHDAEWRGEAAPPPFEAVPAPAERALQEWQGQVATLRAEQSGEVPSAINHPDVGPIDVAWGSPGTVERDFEDGHGLAKIIAKYPEVIDDLPAIVGRMDVTSQIPNRIRLESNNHRAVVRLDYDGAKKTWLLTGFEKEKAPAATVDRRVAAESRTSSDTGSVSIVANAPKVENSVSDVVTQAVDDATLAKAGTTPVFAEPSGGEAVLQTERLMHDIRAAINSGQLDGETFAVSGRYVADDKGNVVPERHDAASILKEFDDDDAALAAIRGCL